MRISELWTKYKEIILYVIFGAGTTLVNVAAYMLCSGMGLSTALSTVTAWVLSVLFAFVTNRRLVFESGSSGPAAVAREMISFFSCRFATGLPDLAIMVVFVDVLGLWELAVKIASNVVVIVLNYAASKLLIFKKKD